MTSACKYEILNECTQNSYLNMTNLDHLAVVWRPLHEESVRISAFTSYFQKWELLVFILPLITCVCVYYFSHNYLSKSNPLSLKQLTHKLSLMLNSHSRSFILQSVYLIFLETRIIELHFAADDSMCLSSFNFFWWASQNDSFRKSAFQPFRVIQGTNRKRICSFLLIYHSARGSVALL